MKLFAIPTLVIAVTPDTLPEHQKKYELAGLNDFIAKPFQTIEIQKSIIK